MAGASGCRKENTALELPSEITHVAILELENNTVVRSSAVQRVDDGHPVWIDGESETVERLILGFREEALRDPNSGVLPENLSADPLRVSDDCAPQIPTPSFLVRGLGSAFTEAPVNILPPLTAKWLEARCAPPPDIELDLRCNEPRCTFEPLELGPCDRELTTVGCGLGTIRLRYEGSALRCMELSGSTWRCENSTIRETQLCGPEPGPPMCPVEVLPKGLDETPALDIQRMTFAISPPQKPDYTHTSNLTLTRTLSEYGHGFDILPLPSTVVVTAIAGESLDQCPRGQDRRLVFIDPETLQVTHTATAPLCLEKIARDGEQFVGGYKGPNGEVMFGRFDLQGHVVESVVLPAGVHAVETYVVAVFELASGWVLLLDRIQRVGDELSSAVMFINPDLSIKGISQIEDIMFGLGVVPPNKASIWLRGGTSGSKLVLFGDDGSIVESSPLQIVGGYRPSTSTALGDRLFLFATDDKEISAFGLNPLVPINVLGVIGEPAYIDSALPWVDGRLILAAGASGGPAGGYRGAIYFIEPEEPRFLSGRTSIDGIGPITRVRADEHGRYWMLMPWDGDILRVSAQPSNR